MVTSRPADSTNGGCLKCTARLVFGSLEADCTGPIMGCMGELMAKIQESGLDPQAVLGGLGTSSNVDPEQLCSVLGDFDMGSVLACVISAQADCGDGQQDQPTGMQMEMAVNSMKYMCTEECKGMEKKMNDTTQCLPTVLGPYMSGELKEESCDDIKAGLQTCIEKKSGCCQTVLTGVKMGLDMQFSQEPLKMVTDVCPDVTNALDGICEGGDSEEDEKEEEEGGTMGEEEAQEDEDDNNSGFAVLPALGSLLLALGAQLF